MVFNDSIYFLVCVTVCPLSSWMIGFWDLFWFSNFTALNIFVSSLSSHLFLLAYPRFMCSFSLALYFLFLSQDFISLFFIFLILFTSLQLLICIRSPFCSFDTSSISGSCFSSLVMGSSWCPVVFIAVSFIYSTISCHTNLFSLFFPRSFILFSRVSWYSFFSLSFVDTSC